MAKQKLPSNELVDDLVRMRREWLDRREPLGDRTRRGGGTSASTLIARVPPSGIPGLAISAPDEPGSATCDIYRLVVGAGTGTTAGSGVEVESMGIADVVFNLSTTAITSRYVLVHELKAGEVEGYVAIPSGGDDEDTGTGTQQCISSIGGVDLNELPIGEVDTGTGPQIEYALGLDSDGCLIRIPIGEC